MRRRGGGPRPLSGAVRGEVTSQGLCCSIKTSGGPSSSPARAQRSGQWPSPIPKTTLTSKGQVTIPEEIRERLGLRLEDAGTGDRDVRLRRWDHGHTLRSHAGPPV